MKESTIWYITGIFSTVITVVAFMKSGWYSRDEIDS